MIPTIFNCVLHYRKCPRQQPSTSFHKDSWITEVSKGEENTNYFSQDSFFYSYQRNRIHTTKSSIKYSSLHSSDSNNSKSKLYVWSIEDQFCKIHRSTSCYTKGLACDRRLHSISNQIQRIICFLHLSQTCEAHRTYLERSNAQTFLKKPHFPNFISISFVCY